jgi:hypothetical protein
MAPKQNQLSKNQGKAAGASRKSVPLTATSPCAEKDLPLTTLPKTVFSQYGSNLTKDGDIFPLVAQIVASASLPSSNPEEESIVDSEPLISVFVSELCTPGGGATSGQNYVTPFKAVSLSEEEKKEVGWQSPIRAAEEAESLREKERRSKSNNDRPSKAHNTALSEVATHLEFSDDNAPTLKLVGDQLQGGQVIPELAAPVARAPRSRASPVDASRKSARGQGLTEGPVLERAMRATAAKDPGNKPLSSFAVLQDTSSDLLLSVAKDSCVVFPSAAGSSLEVLSLIRAKELAQAELAQARSIAEAKLAKEKEAAEAVKLSNNLSAQEEPSPVPVGSGTGAAQRPPTRKSKRGAKKVVVQTVRPRTRQARANGLVS